jgi:putative membrane protein
MMYGYDHGGWMFGGGFVMLLWWLLPIALVVCAAMYLRRRTPGDAEKTALGILKERYARGEIVKEEFEEERRGIGG